MEAQGAALPEPSWGRVARVWWAWTWRWAVFMLVPAAVLSTLFAAALTPRAAQVIMNLLAWPIAVLAQLWAFKKLLKMDFPGFRVRLVDTP